MSLNPDAMAAFARQLETMQAALAKLSVAPSDKPHDRDLSKAMIMSGACPAPLRACDPDEEAKAGRVCPDVRIYAPDPLIVDSEGRICYAPADLTRWAGEKNVKKIDDLIEHAASQLFPLLQDKHVLDAVKDRLLDANVMDATHPRLLGTGACPTFDDNGNCAWTPTMVKDLSTDVLNDGLAKAMAMYRGAVPTTIWNAWGSSSDYVFHAWAAPWGTAGGIREAYANAVNPATLAYAGALAWANRADQMANRLGGEYEAKYVKRVQSLPALLLSVNKAVYEGGLTATYPALANLTFDVAWPMLIERTIGLKGLLRAAQQVKEISGVDKEQMKKLQPREQWDLIVKTYKK